MSPLFIIVIKIERLYRNYRVWLQYDYFATIVCGYSTTISQLSCVDKLWLEYDYIAAILYGYSVATLRLHCGLGATADMFTSLPPKIRSNNAKSWTIRIVVLA